ncbi:hypothetical protein ACFLSA_02180 [Bacteroidota bacterium]
MSTTQLWAEVNELSVAVYDSPPFGYQDPGGKFGELMVEICEWLFLREAT